MISIRTNKIPDVECQQGQYDFDKSGLIMHWHIAQNKLQSCLIDAILKPVYHEHACPGLIPWNPFSIICLWWDIVCEIFKPVNGFLSIISAKENWKDLLLLGNVIVHLNRVYSGNWLTLISTGPTD